MSAREASCSCGQLHLKVSGDPVRVSMCHCLACQRRTGGVFAVQARFTKDQVEIAGRSSEYVRFSDAEGEERRFHFCPECGSGVYYTGAADEDLIAVPVGAFGDPSFPPPVRSVYESRRHSWVVVPDSVTTATTTRRL